jgi:hypothetical protein
MWVWFTAEVEVASWFLGLAYGAIAGAGIAAGVFLRRRLRAS